MARIFARLILAGRYTMDMVPAHLKKAVEKELEDLKKDE